jgi:hypothetical protein
MEGIDATREYNKILESARVKRREIVDLLIKIRTELETGQEQQVSRDLPFVYRKVISPGTEEYLEALLFMYFLENGSVCPYEKFVGETEYHVPIPVSEEEYMYALSDFSGTREYWLISRGIDEICIEYATKGDDVEDL